jgi:hypothetical protein
MQASLRGHVAAWGLVGYVEGRTVGVSVDIGEPDGDAVGKRGRVPIALEEEEEGAKVGRRVGFSVGTADGDEVDKRVGLAVGTTEGAEVSVGHDVDADRIEEQVATLVSEMHFRLLPHHWQPCCKKQGWQVSAIWHRSGQESCWVIHGLLSVTLQYAEDAVFAAMQDPVPEHQPQPARLEQVAHVSPLLQSLR